MIDNRNLAVRLLVPRERWGWEYVVPAPATPSPLGEQAPRWMGVTEPESLQRDRARAHSAPGLLGGAVLISAWGSVLAASWGLALWPAVGAGVLMIATAWCTLRVRRYSAARRRHESHVAQEWSRYEQALTHWKTGVAQHDQREQTRMASEMLWYPVQPDKQWAQVHVFGGTADGWSSLLATLGLSLLSAGSGLLVLDFTERDVAVDLAAMADTVGYAVRADRVPADGVVGVDDLPAAQAGEIVAEVLAGPRGPQPDAGRVQALHAELIEAVCACLDPPRTFERVAAALAVVRRTFDLERRSCLSTDEIRQLTRVTEIVGSSAAVGEELRFLAATMRLLSELPAARSPLEPIWPRAGLRVIATADVNVRRKELLDQFMFFQMLHEVRAADQPRAGAVVIAGADQLNAGDLEALARHTGRVGMRLIVMCEHLRGEQAQLLGAAGSAALLMRLGPAAEAATAADFVGRGHRFVLSQLTEQIGHSFTDGISDTTGDSDTTTFTDNYSPTSAGTSDSRSRARSWSQTSNWSRAQNTSTTHTRARAYEYAVEPTTFQALPATAFVWVETRAHGRRVVAGDCNPGIALLDRVASHPRDGTAAVRC